MFEEYQIPLRVLYAFRVNINGIYTES